MSHAEGVCRSLRDVNSNQLNGTIPPQLGNLTQLTTLYAQNLICFFEKVDQF